MARTANSSSFSRLTEWENSRHSGKRPALPAASGKEADERWRHLADELFLSRWSPISRRTYEAWYRVFCKFCSWRGCVEFPAAPSSVEEFAVWMLCGPKAYAVGTVRVALSAVVVYHRWLGHELPARRFWDMLRGAEATLSLPANRKAPLTWELLLLLSPMVGVSLADLRDWALLLTGFHAALRKAALLRLDVCDLYEEGSMMDVDVLQDKGNPTGLLPPRAVEALTDRPDLCAIAVVRRYLQAAGLARRVGCTKTVARLRRTRCKVCGPLWRQVSGSTGGGRVCGTPLGDNGIKNALTKLLKRLGNPRYPPAAFSAISLRRGSITAMAAADCEEKLRMAHAGHKTAEANRVYVDEDARRRRLASRGLQRGLAAALAEQDG